MNILLSCFYESYYLTIYKYKNSWHFIIHLLNLQIQLSNTHALVQMSNWHFNCVLPELGTTKKVHFRQTITFSNQKFAVPQMQTHQLYPFNYFFLLLLLYLWVSLENF